LLQVLEGDNRSRQGSLSGTQPREEFARVLIEPADV